MCRNRGLVGGADKLLPYPAFSGRGGTVVRLPVGNGDTRQSKIFASNRPADFRRWTIVKQIAQNSHHSGAARVRHPRGNIMNTLLDRRSILKAGAAALGALSALSPALSRPALAASREFVIGINYGLPFLPFIVADKLGYFDAAARDAGIPGATFQLRRFSVATALIDAILSRNVQLGTLGSQALLNAYEKTKGDYHLKGVCAYWKGQFPIFSNQPEVKSIRDIRPTDKIAVQGPKSAQVLYLKRAAEHYFGKDEVNRFANQLVLLPHSESVVALTKARSIQAYVSFPVRGNRFGRSGGAPDRLLAGLQQSRHHQRLSRRHPVVRERQCGYPAGGDRRAEQGQCLHSRQSR